MKKTIIMMLIVSIMMISMSGCFGNFAVVRKVYQFHDGLGDNSFMWRCIRSLLYWFPGGIVYGVASFVDFIVLNLIEFWTGTNPLAMNEGEIETRYLAQDGRTFEVITTKNRYDISEIDNPDNTWSLVFNDEESSWYLYANGEMVKMTEITANETILYDFAGNIAQILPY